MYKVKRFSIIKESLYSLRRNIKSRWSNESDKLVRSSDIRNHPNEKMDIVVTFQYGQIQMEI